MFQFNGTLHYYCCKPALIFISFFFEKRNFSLSLCRLIFQSMENRRNLELKKRKLTDKLKCLLKVLLDVLVGCIIRWYLFIFDSRFILCCWWLTGDVENTIGTYTGRINCVASIAKQEMWENGRCWMRFNICKTKKRKTSYSTLINFCVIFYRFPIPPLPKTSAFDALSSKLNALTVWNWERHKLNSIERCSILKIWKWVTERFFIIVNNQARMALASI